MGTVQSRRVMERKAFEMRRQVRQSVPVSNRVKDTVEEKLFRDAIQPLDTLRQYLNKNDLSRPKRAKTRELSWKELQGCDCIDHPYYNYLTQDFTQFFYDCCWYEYFLRTIEQDI